MFWGVRGPVGHPFVVMKGEGWLMSATGVPWYGPCGDTGLFNYRDPAFPRFCPVNQNRDCVWTMGRNASSKATGHRAAPHTAVRQAPTGHTTTHKGTMMCEHCSNHQMRRTPSEPSANTPPPPSTRCPHTPQGLGLCPARREVPATGVATGP